MRTNKEIIRDLKKLAEKYEYNCNVWRNVGNEMVLVFSPVRELLKLTIMKSSSQHKATFAESDTLTRYVPQLKFKQLKTEDFNDTDPEFETMLNTVEDWLQGNRELL